MKCLLPLFCSLLLAGAGFAQDQKPNVITLLVDDLGYLWVPQQGAEYIQFRNFRHDAELFSAADGFFHR